jgi:hypothetical protein
MGPPIDDIARIVEGASAGVRSSSTSADALACPTVIRCWVVTVSDDGIAPRAIGPELPAM